MKIYKKWALLILGLTLMLNFPLNAYSLENDILNSFNDFIGKYGWKAHIPAKQRPYRENVLVRGTVFSYEFPEEDGYWPHIGFYELTFKDKTGATGFRIENYKRLFPEVVVWEHHEYIRWHEFRNENIVYIVYAYPLRQDIDTFFRVFTAYLKSYGTSDISSLENTLKQSYEKDRNFFHAIKIMQTSFKSRGLYDGTADGIYGPNTKKGLQQFLREKGFYQGEVDGLLGKSSRNAIKQYQKSNGLKTTGRVNLETAKAMQRQNIE
jgi:Putative peptidoglycan binding domain